MRGHDRIDSHKNHRDYSRDLDEYEDDEEDQEGEQIEYEEAAQEEEEEDPQIAKEQMEYIDRREKLKEMIRQQMKKETNAAVGLSQEMKRTLPKDNFGSFFGPSQPVIARRVIEETRAKLEAEHMAAKLPKASSENKKALSSTTSERKFRERDQRLKVVNEMKLKVQKLKDARDYSFLMSGDGELPSPPKELVPRNVWVPSSAAQLSQSPPRRKLDNREKKIVSVNQQRQAKTGPPKVGPGLKSSSSNAMKRPSNNAGSGPGRPVVSKLPPPNGAKFPSSSGGKVPRPNGMKFSPKAPVPTKASSARAVEKKKLFSVVTGNSGGIQKAHLLKKPSSTEKLVKKAPQVLDKPLVKVAPKRSSTSSQHKAKPAKSISSRPAHQARPKKRPLDGYSDEDEGDGGDALHLIRQMFRYDPGKYKDIDDDDSDMEVDFSRIQAEERRSAKIAKEEDERELALIEEEERRERERKAKRLKLKHNQR
ncbi:protein SPT2 homolog [Amborella trichopoda]|uniref:protein SPT2 homolog n=1 Tax=Amborella trichopoda TaxID=13333 RepID=UPI0005D34DAD|nr:protein SPT2 homolog [Amborella trichopoda]XP_020529760.1 protein SPT2 homolog [Amborella trichopoda]XP_020529761.1 protein SPT2 homolog [Amborella trichopoda]|eukprot:XP_011627470.1 protein SPT2 homolog [Amborella trichopoda]